MESGVAPHIQIPAMIIPLIFAVVVHEVAHGWVANRCGDPTAKLMKRLTLNPIRHIDLFGTIIVPTILWFLGGFIFGWAKPVPVDWRNLRNPRRDMAMVAFAGPFTNLIMASLFAILLKFFSQTSDAQSFMSVFLITLCYYGIIINVILFTLNMLPIPPLDGSRIVSACLPKDMSRQYNRLEPFGFFILLGLIFTGVLGHIMMPLINGLLAFIKTAFL